MGEIVRFRRKRKLEAEPTSAKAIDEMSFFEMSEYLNRLEDEDIERRERRRARALRPPYDIIKA